MGSTVLDKNGYLLACNTVATNRQTQACPSISRDIYIGSNSAVIGDVFIKSPVFIGFSSIIKAERGCSLFIGAGTNIHDKCQINVQGSKAIRAHNINWGIYIDGEVSILHGSKINGYCRIGKNTFVGQGVTISDAQIMPNCVIMHEASISGGIIVPEGRYIKPGTVLSRQRDADNLPRVPREYRTLNPDTISGYMELMAEYLSKTKKYPAK